MPKTRRQYAGGGVASTLTGAVAASGVTTFSIASSTNWSTSTTIPFYVVLSPQTSSEEKMLVTLSSNTLTIVSRGVDGTSAASHSSGATIYPVFTAKDADEANELTSTYTTQGDLVYQGSSTFARLGLSGTAGHVLKTNSGLTAPEWGQVDTAGITNNAVTLAKLATAVQNLLVPVGTISAYAGATAPTGWLLCDGTTSTSGYAALAALVGATTPDLKGKFLIGKTATGTGSTLLGSGGSTTIAEGNLPGHSHAVGTLSTVTNGSHSHSGGTGYAGVHQHDYYKTTVTQRAVFNADLDTTDDVVSTYSLDETSIPNEGDGTHFHSIGTDGNHSHTITGSTASTGSGTAYFQPFVAVSYIIKHD